MIAKYCWTWPTTPRRWCALDEATGCSWVIFCTERSVALVEVRPRPTHRHCTPIRRSKGRRRQWFRMDRRTQRGTDGRTDGRMDGRTDGRTIVLIKVERLYSIQFCHQRASKSVDKPSSASAADTQAHLIPELRRRPDRVTYWSSASVAVDAKGPWWRVWKVQDFGCVIIQLIACSSYFWKHSDDNWQQPTTMSLNYLKYVM